MMDEWQSRAPSSQKSEADAVINKYRPKFQGLLAACVQVTAEPIKASELARSGAANALSLLSFLSPANYSSRRTNFGVLLGFQVLGSITELAVTGGSISGIKETVNDKRLADWVIQAVPPELNWVLPALHDLASNRSTEFRKALYDALILHSRQAQARQVSDKLIFTLTALESMLLRDSNEPIQKNLAERMAFLIGQSVEQRKAVVKNVTDVYKVRSAFIHHGASPEDRDNFDEFFIQRLDDLRRTASPAGYLQVQSRATRIFGGSEDVMSFSGKYTIGTNPFGDRAPMWRDPATRISKSQGT